MTATKKLRSPTKTHGGKAYLCRRIIALMPPHNVYCEPFAGGLSVLLNKRRAAAEYVSDLNPAIAMFWSVMGDEVCFPRMFNRVQFQIGGQGDPREQMESAFKIAKHFIEHPPHGLDVIDRALFAAMFLTRNRMSRGGLGKDFAWSDRLRGGQPGDLNSWKTMMAGDLLRCHERMSGVSVLCVDAVKLIMECDGPDVLAYIDPPYVHATRTSPGLYDVEMSDEDHEQLLDTANHVVGKMMISGYRCPLYDRELAGWTRHEFSMPNHSGQGKTKGRRTECVWCNFKGA